jgi:hypothetical protein
VGAKTRTATEHEPIRGGISVEGFDLTISRSSVLELNRYFVLLATCIKKAVHDACTTIFAAKGYIA